MPDDEGKYAPQNQMEDILSRRTKNQTKIGKNPFQAIMAIAAVLSLIIAIANYSSIEKTTTTVENLNSTVIDIKESEAVEAKNKIDVMEEKEQNLISTIETYENFSDVDVKRNLSEDVVGCKSKLSIISNNLSELRSDYLAGNYTKITEYEYTGPNCETQIPLYSSVKSSQFNYKNEMPNSKFPLFLFICSLIFFLVALYLRQFDF